MRGAVRAAVGAAIVGIAAVAAVDALSSRRFLGRAGAGPPAFQAPAVRRTPPRRQQRAARRRGGFAFAQLRAGQAQRRREGAVRRLARLWAGAVGGEVQQGHGVLLAVAGTVRERAAFNAARG
ncbi:hypothetical protein PRJ39_01070 [Lysobacter enzymogenes]|uniref:hypothetical protein n=1 Tax=Lysobacter enzymogenes TaxID=69 RepID=UPI00374A6228